MRAPGVYTTSIIVKDVGGSTRHVTGTATVTDLAVTGSTDNFTAVEGKTPASSCWQRFTDPNTLATVADVNAQLAIGGWGDGTPDGLGHQPRGPRDRRHPADVRRQIRAIRSSRSSAAIPTRRRPPRARPIPSA